VLEPTLYVVATPIGNMNDITLRALEVLKSVDYIISEDPRYTSRLLRNFNIEKQQISYRDENRRNATPKIIDLLKSGKSLALTSDSGTPLISDPGFKLLQQVIEENINIAVVPGPSAVIAALSVSGLPTDKFCFVGFLPRKKSQRADIIRNYGSLDSTLVIYESPYRVTKLLTELKENLGQRYVSVLKELTKVYETRYFGNIDSVIEQVKNSKIKGEFVVLVAKEGFNG
jgi:16S rRNA (cytidine1402-2'-O)-methyltransferase